MRIEYKKYLFVFAILFLGISYTGAYFSDNISVTGNMFKVSSDSPADVCDDFPSSDFCPGGIGDIVVIGYDSNNCPIYSCASYDSEIIITEFMANPAAVNDNVGEYFELYNPTSSDINLNGWRYQDTGNGNWNIITEDIIVAAGSYKVFAASDDSTANGGIVGALRLASSFNLANTRDGILLQKPDGGGGWISVDEIAYDNGDDAWDITSGVSCKLIDLTGDNLDPANWDLSTTPYGDGDLGTPGGPNV